jgi:hypothetical protein
VAKKKDKGALIIEGTNPLETMAVSIFEVPIRKGMLLKHLQRALVNMTLVAECCYTTEQADLAIEIGRKMGELAKLR